MIDILREEIKYTPNIEDQSIIDISNLFYQIPKVDNYIELFEYSIKPFIPIINIDYSQCYEYFYNQENRQLKTEFNINGDLEVKPIENIIIEDEYKEYLPYTIDQLAYKLNYTKENLYDVLDIYDNIVNEHKDKIEIMKYAYKLTHKDNLANTDKGLKDLMHWIENFTYIVEKRINGLKKKNHKVDPIRSKAIKKANKKSIKKMEIRVKGIISSIEKLGTHGFNIDYIWDSVKEGKLINEEIINDVLTAIKDEFGNDHDQIEFDEQKQWNDEIKLYKSKYPNGDPNHE